MRNKSSYHHLFVEDQDDASYYEFHFSKVFPSKKVKIYRCKGKENLEKIEKSLNRTPRYTNLYFFADRDYDTYLGRELKESIYYTDYYSIESEIAKECVFRRIWTTIFHNLPNCEKFESFYSRWEKLLKVFSKRVGVKLFSRVIRYRLVGGKGSLGGIGIKKFVSLDSRGFLRVSNASVIEFLGRNVPHVLSDSRLKRAKLNKILHSLREQEPLCYMRGKQVMELFLLFLRAEKDRLQTKYSASPKFKTDIDFGPGTPFSLLARLTDTPHTLKAYISP